MKKMMIGLILGIFIPVIGGYLFLISGGMPVATKGPPMPMEKFIARTAIRAAMKGQVDIEPPITADEIGLLAATKVYKANCAVCHGLPDGEATAIAKGLFPKPPQLFGEDNVTDDPVGKIYWKVKNGIRLTGMPGFVDTLTDAELWQVSTLLQKVDKLPSSVVQNLKSN